MKSEFTGFDCYICLREVDFYNSYDYNVSMNKIRDNESFLECETICDNCYKIKHVNKWGKFKRFCIEWYIHTKNYKTIEFDLLELLRKIFK